MAQNDLSPEQQLREVVASTRHQLADPEVAAILQQLFPIILGFDLAQSIAFSLMKEEFTAKGGKNISCLHLRLRLRKLLQECEIHSSCMHEL